jgi:hypothetical protein
VEQGYRERLSTLREPALLDRVTSDQPELTSARPKGMVKRRHGHTSNTAAILGSKFFNAARIAAQEQQKLIRTIRNTMPLPVNTPLYEDVVCTLMGDIRPEPGSSHYHEKPGMTELRQPGQKKRMLSR